MDGNNESFGDSNNSESSSQKSPSKSLRVSLAAATLGATMAGAIKEDAFASTKNNENSDGNNANPTEISNYVVEDSRIVESKTLNDQLLDDDYDPIKEPFIEEESELIRQPSMIITFDESKLGEDGIITDGMEVFIDGMKAKIYYSEELYPEISLAKHVSGGGLPKLCEISNDFYPLPDSSYGREFNTTPYPFLYGGKPMPRNKPLYIPKMTDSIYGIIPIVTVWGNGGIVPPRLNKGDDGKYRIIGDSIPSFQIDPNNSVSSGGGHLNGYLSRISKKKGEDFFRIMLIAPTEKIYVSKEYIRPEVWQRYQLGNIDR